MTLNSNYCKSGIVTTILVRSRMLDKLDYRHPFTTSHDCPHCTSKSVNSAFPTTTQKYMFMSLSLALALPPQTTGYIQGAKGHTQHITGSTLPARTHSGSIEHAQVIQCRSREHTPTADGKNRTWNSI